MTVRRGTGFPYRGTAGVIRKAWIDVRKTMDIVVYALTVWAELKEAQKLSDAPVDPARLATIRARVGAVTSGLGPVYLDDDPDDGGLDFGKPKAPDDADEDPLGFFDER